MDLAKNDEIKQLLSNKPTATSTTTESPATTVTKEAAPLPDITIEIANSAVQQLRPMHLETSIPHCVNCVQEKANLVYGVEEFEPNTIDLPLACIACALNVHKRASHVPYVHQRLANAYRTM